MGESPIYACKAHAFTVDPRTKKAWVPVSSHAVPVSFFFDKSRELYRILSVDEAAQDPTRKMTINCILTDRMSFKKTSQKFGQWSDPASGSVYGLGFASESELDKFVEQFCQALDHTRRLRRQRQGTGGSDSHQEMGGGGVDLDAAAAAGERTAGQQQQQQQQQQQFNPESRVAQLEKENATLRSRIRELEDSLSELQLRCLDVPALSNELRRLLLDASELADQLTRLPGV